MAKCNPKKLRDISEPRLDRYITVENKKHYVNYAQAAAYLSLPYYSLVKLVKMAGANFKVGKGVVVDLDVLIDYMETDLKNNGGKK